MKALQFENMIDEEHVIINDMGTAPVVSAMIEVLGIPQTIDKYFGSADPRKKINTGMAAKALIINILYGRTPLVHVPASFKHLDCKVLFGEKILASDFSEHCLGKALEEIGKNDYRKLLSEICINSLKLHGCTVDKIHADTTNISVYGAYDTPPANDFEVTYLRSKKQAKRVQTN